MRQTLTSTQGSHRDLVEILFRSFQSAFFQANRGVIRRVYQSGSGTLNSSSPIHRVVHQNRGTQEQEQASNKLQMKHTDRGLDLDRTREIAEIDRVEQKLNSQRMKCRQASAEKMKPSQSSSMCVSQSHSRLM